MGVEQVAAGHHRRQQALARRAAERVARLWRQVDQASIAASWRRLLLDVLPVVSSAQGIAAASAGEYVNNALEAQGIGAAAEGRVSVTALAGVASDGRDLAELLYQPAIHTLAAISAGRKPSEAMTVGATGLDMIVRTQIADAGRVAAGVAITARPQVTGYVRMLSLPSCSRCIILAGRFYRWSRGFARHPRCDCRHIPAAEDTAEDLRTDPRKAFESLSPTEQEQAFGKSGAEAIRDGADIAQIVNARRGIYTASGRAYTRSGGTSSRRRLMPEQIYLEANGNRDEAIRLLRLHGYLF